MEMLFSCDKCGQQMTIDSQYAGMATTCINCQSDVIIPQPQYEEETPEEEYQEEPQQQQEEPPPSGDQCPRCRNALTSPDAIICMNCGFNLKSGKSIKGKKKSGKSRDGEEKSHPWLAFFLAAIPAAVFGGLWAWAEISWKWWGLSIFILPMSWGTGGIIRLVSKEFSFRMGLAALFMTFGGILFSRLIMTEHMLGKVEQTFTQVVFDKDNVDSLAEIQAEIMAEKGELPNPYTQMFELIKADTPLKDAKYKAAYEQMEKVSKENNAKAKKQVEKMTDKDKEKLIGRSKENITLFPVYLKMSELGELKDYEESEGDYDSDDPMAFKLMMARNKVIEKESMKIVREKYRKMTPAERKKYQGETIEKGVSIFRIIFRAVYLLFSLGITGIINTVFGMIIAWQLATREHLGKS